MKPKILVIVGPNASGKSALGIKLAKKFNGEIVSADSRQIYRGLDIGSGKVTKREMLGVAHHMLDVANPKHVFNVSQYQKLAYKIIDEILSRNKLPTIVGGTGQYISAITQGLIVPEVKPNPKLRARLEKLTNDKLLKLLKALDPARARQIDRHNPRRLVRAIEIAKALGRVPELKSEPRYAPVMLGIRPTIHELRFKIHDRLTRRMSRGMVGEVKKLHKNGLSWKRLESLGLEYRIVANYLRNKLTKKEMLESIEKENLNYAKRQMTWFKREKSIIWLPGNQVSPNPSLVLRIRSLLRSNALSIL